MACDTVVTERSVVPQSSVGSGTQPLYLSQVDMANHAIMATRKTNDPMHLSTHAPVGDTSRSAVGVIARRCVQHTGRRREPPIPLWGYAADGGTRVRARASGGFGEQRRHGSRLAAGGTPHGRPDTEVAQCARTGEARLRCSRPSPPRWRLSLIHIS